MVADDSARYFLPTCEEKGRLDSGLCSVQFDELKLVWFMLLSDSGKGVSGRLS